MNPLVKIKNLTIGGKEKIRIMAAVNLSKESFYKGSVIDYSNVKELERKFSDLLEEGTEIFDFGPKSTAPKDIYGRDTNISSDEEIERLKRPLKVVRELDQNCIISIDTQSSQVAEYALAHGADIINDISGLQADPNLIKVIADYNSYVIIMATKQKPGDVFKTPDVINALQKSKELALKYIPNTNILIDPGIGGWVPQRIPLDDFQLILDSQEIKNALNCPILIALSRKSFIGKILNLPPEDRLSGSLSATAISVLHGADVIRTHDVKETIQAIRIAEIFKDLKKQKS